MAFLQLLFSVCLLFAGSLDAAVTTSNITAYFSPDDHLEKQLIDLIDQEKKSIHICMYTFTHRAVISALIEAKKRGVEVEVIVDRFTVRASSPLYRLTEAAIPIYVWDPDRPKRLKANRPLMHNKFCVFGDHRVWTGSFNFTYQACKMHQENALVVHDPQVAQGYKNQFYTIKLRSCTPLPSFIATNPTKRSKKFKSTR